MQKWSKKTRLTAAQNIIRARHGQKYVDSYWGKKEIELMLEGKSELIDIACERDTLLKEKA